MNAKERADNFQMEWDTYNFPPGLADVIEAAILEEREACAKIADSFTDEYQESDIDGARTLCAIAITAAILKRGQS